jgi:DNA-binding transcriptional MerR regulator
MFPARKSSSELGERVFLSADVMQLAGITLRQLQWWDERKIVIPRKQGHRRIYGFRQVLEILIAGELRHKGLSLQKVRRILRQFRRQFSRIEESRAKHPSWFLLTDGQTVHLERQPERVIHLLAEAHKPMYLVLLNELIERLTADAAPRRYATGQLDLF